jgi:hypothetical protein
MNTMQRERNNAAAAANADDASVWRRLSALLEDRRIKWRYSFNTWVVTVDRRQLATARSFDSAIRLAKVAAETGGAAKVAAALPACGSKAKEKGQ